MYFTLEPATPFERCILWRLHHSYFAQRGILAWREGDIPYFSTSNYAFARQHARFFAALVGDLEDTGVLVKDEPIWFLEAGAGSGIFASNFMRVLENDDAGRPDLYERVRYLLTDYSDKNLDDALATPRVRRYVELGKIVPALYDLTKPTVIHPRDGRPFDPPPKIAFAITNYICCVLPMRHLQKHQDGSWHDLHLEVKAEVDDATLANPERYMEAITKEATKHNLMRSFDITWDWRPTDVGEKLGDPLHVRALERVTEGLVEATLGYPDRFLDAMAGIMTLLLPGGGVMTNDYGSTNRQRLAGLSDWRPQHYGNSFAQDVNFATFDAYAAERGWFALRTDGDLASVHSSTLFEKPPGPKVREAFAKNYRLVTESDDLLDYSNAARSYHQKKESARALRFYLRCAELDPDNTEFRYRVGESAIESGFYQVGIDHLKAGYELDTERIWDFEFQLGRAYCLVNDNATALVWYERSVERAPHPVTFTNMGVLFAADGRIREAYRCYKRALAQDPDYERAKERMGALKDAIWEQTAAQYDREEGAEVP